MRRLYPVVLFICFLFTVFTTIVCVKVKADLENIEPTVGYLLGDTNLDDQVDVADVVLLVRYLTEDNVVIHEHGKRNADFNRDGELNGKDVRAILRYIAHIEQPELILTTITTTSTTTEETTTEATFTTTTSTTTTTTTVVITEATLAELVVPQTTSAATTTFIETTKTLPTTVTTTVTTTTTSIGQNTGWYCLGRFKGTYYTPTGRQTPGQTKGGSGRILEDCKNCNEFGIKGSVACRAVYEQYGYNLNGRTIVLIQSESRPELAGYYYVDDCCASLHVVDFYYDYASNCPFQYQGVVNDIIVSIAP